MKLVQKAKPKKVKKKKSHGGFRENAGRKSLFPGKELERHVTAYLTTDGWKKLSVVQLELKKREKRPVTISDAVEKGLHVLHRELTRAR